MRARPLLDGGQTEVKPGQGQPIGRCLSITVPLSGRQLRDVIIGKVILVQQKLDGDE
jgi:hypothetical protein